MNRQDSLDRLADTQSAWDFVVVGGGATGLGVAVDAASRGYKTLLLEQHDFAKSTSSKSTKLIHGGVRYLRQGNVSLVLESLKERGILRENAPHLVHDLPFIVPNYDWWEAPFYGIGLHLYDLLAGEHGFGKSHHLDKEETLERIPTLEADGLRGGTIYYDGQFDDARLAINLAQTAVDHGAAVLNYVRVTGLTKSNDLVSGVIAVDAETQLEYGVKAKAVINATGVFTDALVQMDDPGARPMISPSQGVHIVLDRSFLPGDSAIMVPHTDDGRILFAIPWHGRALIGTTDTPVSGASLEPLPMKEELEFLIVHAARYLTKDPEPVDVLSAFAGLRPLVKEGGGDGDTASISRDHTLHIARSGLISIAGGKWTTYRKMAEDTVDQAWGVAGLGEVEARTKKLRVHGHCAAPVDGGDFESYGSDAEAVRNLCAEIPGGNGLLASSLPYRAGEVAWAAREEMARTVEDVLARRTRSLLLDAPASVKAAPLVAKLLAVEMGKDQKWQEEQVKEYEGLARGYIVA